MQEHRASISPRKFVVPAKLAVDDVLLVRVLWGAKEFSTETVYKEGDLVRPSDNNGLHYKCDQTGVSGSVDIDFLAAQAVSGGCRFSLSKLNLVVAPGEHIVESIWAATGGVMLGESAFTAEETSVPISKIPTLTTKFTLTNRITKDTGERVSYALVYKIDKTLAANFISYVSGSLTFSNPEASGLINVIL
jgi:hypothetical protein